MTNKEKKELGKKYLQVIDRQVAAGKYKSRNEFARQIGLSSEQLSRAFTGHAQLPKWVIIKMQADERIEQLEKALEWYSNNSPVRYEQVPAAI